MSRSWRSGEKKGKRKRNALRKEREKNRRRAQYQGELAKQAREIVEANREALPLIPPPPTPPSPASLMTFGAPNENK